jgi:hypothetical protein
MRFGWLAVVAALAVLGTVPAGAGAFRGPGGQFVVNVEGEWTAETPEQGALVLLPKQAAPGIVALLFAPAEVDPCKAIAPQLIKSIQESPDEFPGARDFRELRTQVLGQDCQGISMHFESPEGASLTGIGVVFAVGAAWHIGAVIGAADADVAAFARQVFAALTPAQADAVALSADRTPVAAQRGDLPEGWLMRTTADGRALQVFEESQQAGALGELCLLPRGNRGASAVLREAFYAPLADTLRPGEVAADPGDTMAKMTYRRNVGDVELQGEAIVAVTGEDALFAHVCAPTDQYAAKEGQVKRLLSQLLGTQEAALPARTAQAQRPVPPLTPTYNRDGSAVISVPQGWTVDGAEGVVIARGPEAYVVFGVNAVVTDPATAMLPAGTVLPDQMLAAPYMPPAQAVAVLMPKLQRLGGGMISNVAILDSSPLPQGPNWAAVDLLWDEIDTDRNWGRLHILATAGTIPGMGTWLFFANLVAAPEATYRQLDAFLAAIVKSRRVLRTPSTARRPSVDTSGLDIISEVYENRSRSQDINARKWSAYMRDETPTIDDSTGRARMLGSVQDLNRWMDDDPNLRLDNLHPMNMDDWHRADIE